MADLPSRVIIRDHAFEDELRLLIPDAERADEYTAAAETILAQDPTVGLKRETDEEAVWVLPMSPINEKSIYLLYTFDAAEVILLGLRVL